MDKPAVAPHNRQLTFSLPCRMSDRIASILSSASEVILGKPQVLKLSLSCLLAQGHLLIEDVPGVGKTTLAQALAHLLGLQYRRIQFTSDLLPADIAGVSVFDKDSGQFRFQPGPVFCQVLLADEINRASPKTQSALLEAMEEGQVTSDGETRSLPQPFFVIATQNPLDQIGTFASRALARIRAATSSVPLARHTGALPLPRCHSKATA